jgi:hypothetical protein
MSDVEDRKTSKHEEAVQELVDSGVPRELAEKAVAEGAGEEIWAKVEKPETDSKEKVKDGSKDKAKDASKAMSKEEKEKQAIIDKLVAGGMDPDLAKNAVEGGAYQY